jgi:hypothetical protein
VFQHITPSDSYALYCIDGEMVEKYLHVVEGLEASYQRTCDDERKKNADKKFKFGPFTIYITKDS